MKEFKNYYRHGFAYNTYVCGNDKLFPNSKDEMNKKEEQEEKTILVATFNVTSTSSATLILYNYSDVISAISEMEIDGVVQPGVVTEYIFSTTGEHTVKYTLVDSTSIDSYTFAGCTDLTNITIPDNVTSIGESAFRYCIGLKSIIIPGSVSSIGTDAFRTCKGLTSITSLATTAPTIQTDTFYDIKTGGTLYVPEGTTVTGYGAWMRTDNYYLGKYGWSIVEV